MLKIGLIGGSGLESLDVFHFKEELRLTTTYGDPSSTIYRGEISGKEVFILSRHDRDHTIPPSQVNNLANIEAFRMLGCQALFSTTACGSLREEIRPGDLVVPDQFIDFTRFRKISFFEHFEKGNPAHTPMADPFSPLLRNYLVQVCQSLQIPVLDKATILTIEGPRFSTRAESAMYRIWGADLVNMSVAPEVILANEAGIPYATIAMSTDYDAWRTDVSPVSWDELLAVFQKNADAITRVLTRTIELIDQRGF